VLLTVDLARLELRRGERLLDAGCGEGRHCFGALDRGVDVVGLDLDFSGLRAHRERLAIRAKENGCRAIFVQGNTFHLPFPDASFDKVICSEVMEHVHDYRAAARELARVTKPGGHIRIFRPRDLAQGLAAAGLATVGVGFAHALHTPYWVLRSIAGLPHADTSRLVRMYRQFLIRATVSRGLSRLERVLNFCFPKSLILYAEKPLEAPRDQHTGAPRDRHA